MRNYRDLKVWKKAHQLTLSTYLATRRFPKEEMYGITSQIRRASVSIEANLAEGCGRRGDGEMVRFVHFAMGSASELDCHLLLARDLHLLRAAEHDVLQGALTEVRRMLTSFLDALQAPRKSMAATGNN